MKILTTIGNKITPRAKEILEELGAVDAINLSQAEFEARIMNYDVLLLGLGVNFKKSAIDKAKKLKVVATATTGLDHIDVGYAEKKGITVLSLRGEVEFLDTITGTAELAFGLMIDLARLTHSAFDSVKRYEWDREKFWGHNLYGRTLGIFGLGRLGGWMARYGKTFGMKVIAYDPHINDGRFKKLAVRKISFDELLAGSDIISIHVHLNQETENMFNAAVLNKMKNTAYLINTSRGRIVNENDLLRALENKKIAGYAADVLANELNFKKEGFGGHPLVEYAKKNKNAIIVPHIGGMTHESRIATDVFIAEKIVKYLHNK